MMIITIDGNIDGRGMAIQPKLTQQGGEREGERERERESFIQP
jgi:hypothetical protein